jgi:hypothetical protein
VSKTKSLASWSLRWSRKDVRQEQEEKDNSTAQGIGKMDRCIILGDIIELMIRYHVLQYLPDFRQSPMGGSQ